MFEIRVKVDFPAAHHLEGYPGDCARPHGHNWVLEVFARSSQLDSLGMAIDFRDLKKAAKEIIAPWDHQDLNQLPEFQEVNPSAEQIAKIAFDKLSDLFNHQKTWIDRVTLWENERCYVTYFDSEKRGTCD